MKTLSPAVITLPWRQDAAERYFSTLSHLPWAMLLHSGHADHPHNRFAILVADPVATLVTCGEETVVHDGHATVRTFDDPMTVLHSVLSARNIHPDYHPDLPFQGGALGLLGYDLGRRFESPARYCRARHCTCGYGDRHLRLGADCRSPVTDRIPAQPYRCRGTTAMARRTTTANA